jgi:hypothetical protein
MRRTAEVAGAVLLMVALAGCISNPFDPVPADPNASTCAVPWDGLAVSPQPVAIGGTLTITGAPTGCDPGRDYELVIQSAIGDSPIESPTDPIRTVILTTNASADGGFETTYVIPQDFSRAGGVVSINAPYPPCPFNDLCGSANASIRIDGP